MRGGIAGCRLSGLRGGGGSGMAVIRPAVKLREGGKHLAPVDRGECVEGGQRGGEAGRIALGLVKLRVIKDDVPLLLKRSLPFRGRK